MAKIRELISGQELEAGEILVLPQQGPLDGRRLALALENHKKCGGTGRIDGKTCECVSKVLDRELHGARCEIDWRTRKERLQDELDHAKTNLTAVAQLAQAELAKLDQGIREARQTEAQANADLEQGEELRLQADQLYQTAREKLGEARTALREAEANEREAKKVKERVDSDREALMQLSGGCDKTVCALEAQKQRTKATWEPRINVHKERVAKLEEKLAREE